MGGKGKIACQINCFSINHFYKRVDNKVGHRTSITFNQFNI